jgi:hypothetical protein
MAVTRRPPETTAVVPVPVPAIVVVVGAVTIRVVAVFVFVAFMFAAELVGLRRSSETAQAAGG